MAMGVYCPCLSSSVSLTPLFSSCWVAASRSDPNWAKAATSRYWANSSFMDPATCFMALVCAAEPTRLTDRPTLIAGRIPL
uniref:Putative secreted protein n=1 Tax=Ixodes ricinus TaxID=34613 RepID=A0A6B0UDC9_IXORI